MPAHRHTALRVPAVLALAALLVMGVALWLATGNNVDWLHWSLSERILRLTAVVACGALAYFVTLHITGFRLRDFKRRAAE